MSTHPRPLDGGIDGWLAGLGFKRLGRLAQQVAQHLECVQLPLGVVWSLGLLQGRREGRGELLLG